MSRMAPSMPPRPSVMARSMPPVETVKMVMLGGFDLFRIWSRVSLEKVSRPVAMRMMYFGLRCGRAGQRFVKGVEDVGSEKPGICSE